MGRHKTALLEFFLVEDNLFTFVVRPDMPEFGINDKEPLVFEAQLGEAEVAALVHKIRSTFLAINQLIEKNAGSLDTAVLDRLTETSLEQLNLLGRKVFSDELLSSLEAFNAIYLVPFGQLHYLPLHAVSIKGQYLHDLFKIAYLPSASVLQYFTEKGKPANPVKEACILGVDYRERSRFFESEAQAVEQKLKEIGGWGITAHTRQEATKENLLSSANGKSLVHISSHGYFSKKDAMDSGALLFGCPAAFDGEDVEHFQFVLTAKDIFEKLQLEADLVVLSACVTGESLNKPGDELIGLTRALMFAGANSAIVSLFPTFKNVTGHRSKELSHTLFSQFYHLWLVEGLSKAEALQAYCQGIRREPIFQNPFLWFSYILVGDMG
ncbi:MAG: CHAT domain-containing protein [Lewinellaceae bacterium]|nr:CHAT domain-containing protein [Saprospiraceae bacterium]MCB9341781.1 CHAT domain-containing protein [Lewinellaceae bacterium]